MIFIFYAVFIWSWAFVFTLLNEIWGGYANLEISEYILDSLYYANQTSD